MEVLPNSIPHFDFAALFTALMAVQEATPMVEAAKITDRTIINWRNFLIYINAKNSWQYMVVQVGMISFSFALVIISQYAVYQFIMAISP